MTDVFGEWVPRYWQREMLDGMFVAPKQTFQVLTKRPEIMSATLEEWLDSHGLDQLPSNIWTGTSIENIRTLKQRSQFLSQIPAQVRFWSVEPLLENLGDISQYLNDVQWVIIGENLALTLDHATLNGLSLLFNSVNQLKHPCLSNNWVVMLFESPTI